MASATLAALLCAALAVATAATAAAVLGTDGESTTYIVHVAAAHAPRASRTRLLSSRAYDSFLRDHLPVDVALPAPRVLYSYAHAATGFAARLTERQAARLASLPSVLAVVPDATRQLHTTLTPSFLRLSSTAGLLPASNGATDVVIGVIDTGIYPKDRASFAADPSLPPPPRKFRGSCVSTPSFNASAYCNNKLVGAKSFNQGYVAKHGIINVTEEAPSPLDTNGHGTHTASTATGSAVADAGFYNYARGKAVGMAPGARIAAYKVCWDKGCEDSDILAAFEEAIADSVDIISFSIGAVGMSPEFKDDITAIGSFSAVRKGIVVSASAGNSGPGESTVVNIAPWILTVGASTINRRFSADVVLGNGVKFTGTSLYAGEPLGASKIPVVFGGDAGSSVCAYGILDHDKVAGKIVLCYSGENDAVTKAEAVKVAGGVGAIIVGEKKYGEEPMTSPDMFPATSVTFSAGEKINEYITKSSSPTATIVFWGTVVGPTPSSPRMASFSSRGPNVHAPEILKPDVTAPGVDILAAWTGDGSPSGLANDTRRVQYSIISGTSMSCPHVSGLAALLRQLRPAWSPAAIKSALMTTAYNVDNAGNTIKDMSTGMASTPFVRGAGHVLPNSAADPGLVYDAGTDDYISFLCALGYTAEQVALFTRDGSVTNCPARTRSVGDLNYPSFSAVFSSDKNVVTQRRVVRNVGSNVWAMYTPRITSPPGVRVTVTPWILWFNSKQQTQEYEITFSPRWFWTPTEKYSFGSIVWSDGSHTVTSPIAITWPASAVEAI